MSAGMMPRDIICCKDSASCSCWCRDSTVPALATAINGEAAAALTAEGDVDSIELMDTNDGVLVADGRQTDAEDDGVDDA